MISVSEAKKIIKESTSALPVKRISLQHAAGLVLAEDIFSPINIPSFNQSSMDGYAFSFGEWQSNKKLKIEGTIPAGSNQEFRLKDGTTVRIFTGAPVPEGADTVVMQEKIKIEHGELIIEDESLQCGMNVRPIGAEIKTGSLALANSTILTPAAIGLLASLGITDMLVHPKPSVCIIVTGDELQESGKILQHGQVYEANSFSLRAALQQQRIDDVKIFYANDSLEELTETLKVAISENDVIFLTGGISVGDFDFVLQATIHNSVQKLFHRIKQRPAKPLFFGKKENKYIFGLPGNPASGLTSFYEYALPSLGIMCNRDLNLKMLNAPLKESFKKPAGLTYFLKGFYDGEAVLVLDAQESFRLSSFAKANCLIQIDEEVTERKEGELVEVHLLPV